MSRRNARYLPSCGHRACIGRRSRAVGTPTSGRPLGCRFGLRSRCRWSDRPSRPDVRGYHQSRVDVGERNSRPPKEEPGHPLRRVSGRRSSRGRSHPRGRLWRDSLGLVPRFDKACAGDLASPGYCDRNRRDFRPRARRFDSQHFPQQPICTGLAGRLDSLCPDHGHRPAHWGLLQPGEKPRTIGLRGIFQRPAYLLRRSLHRRSACRIDVHRSQEPCQVATRTRSCSCVSRTQGGVRWPRLSLAS
jgi:hypothetical protein